MEEKLKALYQSVILRHNREPFHYEKRPEATVVLEAYNPLCGDKYKLFLEIEDDHIREAYFHGYGCAISKASTSVLLERIVGKNRQELADLMEQFYEVVDPEANPDEKATDEALEAFAGARQFPGRLKCATLSWDSLKAYFLKDK